MTTITKKILIDTANHIISRDDTSLYSENLRELARIALASLESEARENSVHDLFLRAKAMMYQSGGSPIEHSLNPVDAWLFEAERCNSAVPAEKCRSGENVQEVPPVCRRAPAWTGSNCVDPRQCYIAGWNSCRADMLKAVDHTNLADHSGDTDEKVESVSDAYKLPAGAGSSLQLRNLIRQRHAEWSEKTFGNVGHIGPLKHLAKEAMEAAAEPDDLSEWADMQFLLWDAQRRAGISDEQITQAMIEKLAVNKQRQWPKPKDGEPRLHIKPAASQREEKR